MSLYRVQYKVHHTAGDAIVTAQTPKEAINILNNQGKFNGYKYDVFNVQEIPQNSLEYKGIVSEINEDLLNKDQTPSKVIIVNSPLVKNEITKVNKIENPPFNIEDLDINKLTDEQIRLLKLRINENTKTLYVDTIATGHKISKPKADPGHTIFIVDGYNKSASYDYTPGHLYISVKNNNITEYVDLGAPTKYWYIESQSRIVDFKSFVDRGSAGTLTYNYKPGYRKFGPYGIFIRDKSKSTHGHKWVLLQSVISASLSHKLGNYRGLKQLEEKSKTTAYPISELEFRKRVGEINNIFRDIIKQNITYTDSDGRECKALPAFIRRKRNLYCYGRLSYRPKNRSIYERMSGLCKPLYIYHIRT